MDEELSREIFGPRQDSWRAREARIRPNHTFDIALGTDERGSAEVILKIDEVVPVDDDHNMVRQSLIQPGRQYGEETVIHHRWYEKVHKDKKIAVGQAVMSAEEEHKLSPQARRRLRNLVVIGGGLLVTKVILDHSKHKKS
jgi:hypothetical protein